MTKSVSRQQFTFILVRPRYPGNLGAAARALKNMGFSSLRLVSPSILPTHPEARRLAVGAEPLLKKARVFDSLAEAVADLDLLVGTTCRQGKYRKDFVLLPNLRDHLPPKKKIGILFGPEERGLTNKQLAHCQIFATIPSNPRFPSLNLAQSVMTVAYELRRNSNHREKGAPPKKDSISASVEKLEAFYKHLEETLQAIDFLPHKNPFHIMRTLRQLFNRSRLTEREVRILRGICQQINWAAKTPVKTAS